MKPNEEQAEATAQNKPNKALVDVTQRSEYLDPVQWAHMKSVAADFQKSGALPKTDNEYTVLMKLQAGLEMGMKPVESIKSFYFVNGNINIFGAATMRRIREHGWTINYKDEENKCTVTVKKGEEEYSDTLTFEEADKSGWVKDSYGKIKPAWREGANRKLKLRYGATSMLLKTYIPEVLGSATDIAEVAMDYDIQPEKPLVDVPDADQPAKMEQIETLKQMGIEIPEGLTRGQAVELMTSKPKKPSKKVEKEEEKENGEEEE